DWAGQGLRSHILIFALPERALSLAVQWRKISFGNRSDRENRRPRVDLPSLRLANSKGSLCLDLSYPSGHLPPARIASGIFTPKIFVKHLNFYKPRSKPHRRGRGVRAEDAGKNPVAKSVARICEKKHDFKAPRVHKTE